MQKNDYWALFSCVCAIFVVPLQRYEKDTIYYYFSVRVYIGVCVRAKQARCRQEYGARPETAASAAHGDQGLEYSAFGHVV